MLSCAESPRKRQVEVPFGNDLKMQWIFNVELRETGIKVHKIKIAHAGMYPLLIPMRKVPHINETIYTE